MSTILLSFNFFPKSVHSVLPTENLNSLYDLKASNVQTKKINLNCFLPNEPCSVSHISLRYRAAKLINCLLKLSMGTVVFSITVKRKPLKHMIFVIVGDQTSKTIF